MNSLSERGILITEGVPKRSIMRRIYLFLFGLLSFPCLAQETVIELESYIVGDKEQPAVSYFVPWKGTSAPDKLHWNIEDKNDQTLNLVDREVMLRSIDIYNELKLEEPVE